MYKNLITSVFLVLFTLNSTAQTDSSFEASINLGMSVFKTDYSEGDSVGSDFKENNSIAMRETNIIRSGQTKLNDLDDKINELNKKINRAHITLKKLIEENTTITYSKGDIAGSIKKANSELINKIKDNISQELKWKEKHISAEWDKSISTTGSPVAAVASNAVQIKKQFETNFGKIEQYIEINEIKNNDYTKQQGRNVVYTKVVDKLWLYPVREGEGWKLNFIATFKITGKNGNNNNGTGSYSVSFVNYTEPTANLNLKMVAVKGGTFKMGSNGDDDEQPIHSVTVSDFYIGKYEVTQAQWNAIMGSNPSYFKGNNLPVEKVSWDDVQEFIKKLNQKTDKKYRLPTEAEWEYAARGGSGTPYFFEGDPKRYVKQGLRNKLFGVDTSGINTYIAYMENSGARSGTPEERMENPFGLVNMLGNVAEFCSDWYSEDAYAQYGSGFLINPQGPSAGEEHVIRGGSYRDGAEDVRCASRDYTRSVPWLKTDPQMPKSIWWYSDCLYVGFRVVCEFEEPGANQE